MPPPLRRLAGRTGDADQPDRARAQPPCRPHTATTPATTPATEDAEDAGPNRSATAAMPGHQQKFGRTPAMPLIRFDIPHGHRLTDPTRFGNRFSEAHRRAPSKPENRDRKSVV